MGRTRKFDRTRLLEQVAVVFLSRGFSATTLRDLEVATGVNKSGLYSEFKNKEELFLETLRHFYSTRKTREILNQEPLGWGNIERLLLALEMLSSSELKGCLGTASLREWNSIPVEAQELIGKNQEQLKGLLITNISAESTGTTAESVADIVSTFLSGVLIEQSFNDANYASTVQDFLKVLRIL